MTGSITAMEASTVVNYYHSIGPMTVMAIIAFAHEMHIFMIGRGLEV